MEDSLDAVSERREASGVHDHHEGGGSNDHLASIYESQEDQFEAVVPFIQRGLERGERCLYVADDNTTEEILDALREGGIGVEAARESGALSIHTKADTYLRTDEFEQDAMLDFWRETLVEARDEEGYTGVRAAAEMTWALDEGTDLDRLVQYEAMLNTIYSGEDYAVLCQYNRERFPADVISDVIRSHPLVVYDGTVCRNFYYHPPDEFFGTDHSSLDVDRTVEGLVSRARTQHALQEREHQLHERLHQQDAVAEIGHLGLEEHDLDSLLADVTRQVADTLDADYCKVLELLPDGEELLLRKGVGWQDGVVGETTVGTDHDSQAGYTLVSERPVIVEDLATESRFSGPDLLVDHDVTSGISVVIGPVDDPWGVLGVHTREQRDFSDHDAAFVRSVANTVATAIGRAERERYQRELYEITADPARSFDEKLQALFDLGCERFDLELGGLARVDPATDLFEVEATSGGHEHLVPGAQVALSETYCRVTVDGGGTAGITDPVDSGFEGTMAYDEFGVNAYLGTRIEIDGDLDRTFFFVSSEPRAEEFSEAEHTFHRLMGQWVSYELERQQREDNLAALNALTRDLMHDETVTDVSESVIDAAEETLELPVAAIALYDDQQGVLESVAETDPAATLLRATSLLDVGAGTAWEAFVEDAPREQLDPLGESDVTLHPSVTEVAVFPLGKQGVFVVGSTATDGFTSTDFDFVETVVANTRAAFDRADREQQVHEREAVLESQNETLERLNRVNDIIRSIDQALVDASTRTEIETVVCEQLADAGPYELAWIGEHDPVTDEITPRRSAGAERGYLDEITVTADDSPEGQGPGGRAVRTRELQVANDILDDPQFEPYRQAALNRGYHAHVALPLVYEGSLYGVLNVYAGQPGVFDDLERSVLAELSDTIAYAINAVESKKALVSDTITELTFDIHDTGIEIVALSSELGCTITLESVIPQPDGRLRIFFSTRGVAPATFADATSRMPVADLSLISEHEENGDPVGVFDALLTDESFYATILEHGGVPREIAVGNGDAHVLVELAADADTREFVETFRTNCPGAELVAQRTRERAHQSPTEVYASLTNSLTDRQLEVLQTAYFSGYFEKPRTQTGSEIASSLDITQPTFNHHVRAAQRKLWRSLFEDDDSTNVASYGVD